MSGIPQHERFLIVLGMARSGTTIFTYTLCKHPQIALFRGGPEAWLLENSALLNKGVRRLSRIATLFPDSKYVTLKRPWQEEHAEWFRDHMPHARYIIVQRDRESQIRSWQTTGRFAMAGRRDALADPNAYYDRFARHAERFPQVVGQDQCRTIQYADLTANPEAVLGELADWLGVTPDFGPSPITSGGKWHKGMAEEFPRGDSLLDGWHEEGRAVGPSPKLAIYVLTWRRPHLLRRTLDSLFRQLDAEPDLKALVNIANNGSDPATREVIEEYADRLDQIVYFRQNIGIAQAFETMIPPRIPTPYLMLSEDDVEYRQPLSQYLDALDRLPRVGAVTGYHSQYHPIRSQRELDGKTWLIKRMASTVHLVMKSETYERLRPIEVPSKRDFDCYLMRQSPRSLQKQGLKIGVRPGGVLHLGWKESTWSGRVHAEYTPEQLATFGA